MRTRIAFTVLVVCAYIIASWIYGVVESPVSGAVTAAQLDDTVASYAAAKFVRDGGVGNIFKVVAVVAIVVIWTVGRKSKNTNTQT